MKLTDSVGIFGGSFNPITSAHVRIAEIVAKQLKLSWLLFEPIYNKDDLIDVEHRINMIQKIFDDSEPVNGTIFGVGSIDALSFSQMCSHQLLQRYRNMFRESELFFVMGSDNLKEFHSWKQPEKIFELANLAVFGRNMDDITKIISTNPVLSKNINKIHVFDSKHINLSASLVRGWLKNKNIQISGRYLPKKVLNYIRKNKLYENNT